MGEIRDPIYGFITPSEFEFKIINTSIFQRLRKIKQLAMAHLVYPGANHTRFDHSLGVYHIASLMAEKILPGKDYEEKRRIVRLSALLHDIGHGPFSHISEDILEKYSKHDCDTDKEKIHEKITIKLIENNKELGELLSSHEKDKIIGLLSGKMVDFTLMKEIISGPIDADKMDYLLRDSYFCGVKYGIFDHHRMLNTLTSYAEGQDKHLAVDHDGINSLEQFVLAKYYMTIQVYRHKIRSVSDAMIIRGLELGIEKDGIDFLKRLYCFEDTTGYIDNYINYHDERIVDKLIHSDKNGFAKEIFKRLNQRRLFKTVFSKKLMDIEIGNEEIKDRMINISSVENSKLRSKLEQQIANLDDLKCEKEFVIANSFTIKSVKEMSRNSEGEIIIIDRKEDKKVFEKESTVFNSIDESMKDIKFEIYAPVRFKDQQDKNKKLDRLETNISEILKNMEG
ncbi:MAG: HD domain-containing protein [bacterium]